MKKQTILSAAGDDPQPALTWEVVYSDSFDRHAPPSVEVVGTGLVPGLVELWARFLFETVKGDGLGFSRFTLATSARTQISIEIPYTGDMRGASRLRRWVFGDVTSTMRGVLDEANLDRLTTVAHAHGRLLRLNDATNLLVGRPYCQPILDAVAAHVDDDLVEVLASVGAVRS